MTKAVTLRWAAVLFAALALALPALVGVAPFRGRLEPVDLLSEALRRWLRSNVEFVATKKGMVAALALAVLFMLINMVARRLPLRPLFIATSFFLLVMAIKFIGDGIHEFQEQAMLPYSEIRDVGWLTALGLNPTVEAVDICVPNDLHRPFAERAFAARKHVLCEKPMAVTSQDCQAMIEAARQNHVKLMIAYRLHLEAGNLEAIRLARSGKLGELRFFASEFSQEGAGGNVLVTDPAAGGGGPVDDLGGYCIKASRYLFGSEPTEVFAVTVNH